MNVLDIETFNINNKVSPFCVISFFKNKKEISYGEDCLLHHLSLLFLKKFKKEIIFVHNLNFDGFLLIEALTIKKWKFEIFCRELNLYSITIYHNDQKLTFKCSYKILPRGLEEIAREMGIENKLKFPYSFINQSNLYYSGKIPSSIFFNSKEDWEIFSKNNSSFDVKLYTIKYCWNDINITLKFLNNLQNILEPFKINLNQIFSAPSLALKIFEKKFNQNKVRTKQNHLIERFARKAYFGGRCEVYGNPYEDDKIFHYDFTGMYAQCMKEKFPIGNYKIELNCDNISKPGMYWVEFISKNSNIPVLPHHRIKDGKLMFTNGEMIGCYWKEELELFLEEGGVITKILYALTFEQYENVFEEYVNFFTKMRDEGGIYNIFGKLMINSTYGRLGMRDIDTHSFIMEKQEIEKIEKKIEIKKMRELNNFFLIEATHDKNLEKILKIDKKNIKNNLIIAATITSKARIKLYRAQKDVLKNGGRLLYSDTDSIFAAFKKDVTNEKHGDVFWDGGKKDTCIKEALFFSPKSYAIKYLSGEVKIKIKGYNQKTLNFDELKRAYLSQSLIKIEDYRFLAKKNLNLTYIETLKHFDLNFYDKRRFDKARKETTPLEYKNYLYK